MHGCCRSLRRLLEGVAIVISVDAILRIICLVVGPRLLRIYSAILSIGLWCICLLPILTVLREGSVRLVSLSRDE